MCRRWEPTEPVASSGSTREDRWQGEVGSRVPRRPVHRLHCTALARRQVAELDGRCGRTGREAGRGTAGTCPCNHRGRCPTSRWSPSRDRARSRHGRRGMPRSPTATAGRGVHTSGGHTPPAPPRPAAQMRAWRRSDVVVSPPVPRTNHSCLPRSGTCRASVRFPGLHGSRFPPSLSHARYRRAPSRIPAALENGQILVSVRFNGHPGTFRLDTEATDLGS